MGEAQEKDTKTIMPMKPKVTVLVAVYNSEKYLSRCLDSLVGQTLEDIQVVCVDDASTDNSPHILDSYASQDSRIEVIHLNINQGQAHARNRGLAISRGEYICFLDSDDWFSADCLQKAVEAFSRYPLADSLLFDTIYVYSDHEEHYNMPPFEKMTGQEAFEASLTWKIHGVYIVRANIHKRYPYDESARAYSDDNTTRLHYLASREVRTCNGIYFYRQHAESVTHKPGRQRFDYLTANASMKKTLTEMNVGDRILDIYENVRWMNVVDALYFIYNNRKTLSAEDKAYGEQMTKQTWATIETGRLTARSKWKLGYMPMKWSWKAFKAQTTLYFWLKTVLFS